MVIIYANKTGLFIDGKCYTIKTLHTAYMDPMGLVINYFRNMSENGGDLRVPHRPRPQVIPGFRFEALKKAPVRPSSSSRASPSSVSPAEFRPSGEAMFRRGEWEKWGQVMAFFVMKMDIVWTNHENYMGLWKKLWENIGNMCFLQCTVLI